MPALVHVSLEPNSHNSDGFVVTLYFGGGKPTIEQIREICKTKLGSFNLGVDTEDPFFGFEEHSTPVSVAAGLRRYEVYPTC